VLTSMRCSRSFHWRDHVTSFADKLALEWISSQRFRRMTSLCFSWSAGWRACASANEFAEESVLQRISSLTRLRCSKVVHWQVCALANLVVDESMIQRISSLTSLCITESIRWRVYDSSNLFADEVEV